MCPTLYDPIDGSPPGSPVPGILQARTLEWVAIFFSINREITCYFLHFENEDIDSEKPSYLPKAIELIIRVQIRIFGYNTSPPKEWLLKIMHLPNCELRLDFLLKDNEGTRLCGK